MRDKLRALVVLGVTIVSVPAFGTTNPEGYVTDSSGRIIRSGTGLCWRTVYWTPAMAVAECDPDLIKLEAPRPAAVAASAASARPPAAAPAPMPTVAVPERGEVYPLWYATNRKPIDVKAEAKGYTNDTDNRVYYGKVFVEIPEDFLKELRSPSWLNKLRFRSAESMLKVRAPIPLSPKGFIEDIRSELADMKPDERFALIYLHGFQTTFIEAAQRAAAIGYQLKVPVTGFFSWPSKGKVASYISDNRAVERSEEEIARFLVKFVRESGAKRVHLIAHSMGNYGLLRSMLRPFMQAAHKRGVRFGQVILAAPDVDTNVFLRDAPTYRRFAERVTVYASSKDRALLLSKELSDFPRAGLMPPPVIIKGIDTVDVGPVNLTILGHSYVAEEIPVLQDMHTLITQNVPPEKRFGIKSSGSYWILK